MQRYVAGEVVVARLVTVAYRLRKLIKRNKGPATAVSTWFALYAIKKRDLAVASEAEANRQTARASASAKDEATARQEKADAEAFTACGTFDADERTVTLISVPTVAAARHT